MRRTASLSAALALPARRVACALALAALLAACVGAPTRPAVGGFVERRVVVEGVPRRYRVWVPAHAASGARPPAILFLHGAGERGDDNLRQTEVGLGPHLRAHAATFPALVVLPQAPPERDWSDEAAFAVAALDAAVREFDADPSRVYLTGLSMGGYGTWELALRHPARFAALVPVCPGVTPPAHRPTLRVDAVAADADPFAALAARLRDVPLWIFHGARDDVLPVGQSRRAHAALRAAGARDARYTEFPDTGHDAWDPAYATDALWPWLFAQRRPAR
ncbi:prolyl oligopeptidase family serine peptidase [Tolypothrix campylonemoides VB511288]|nr:prolyl oligopeptidase family serine peptidase [Tolypothrix campylonemoides VB511288]